MFGILYNSRKFTKIFTICAISFWHKQIKDFLRSFQILHPFEFKSDPFEFVIQSPVTGGSSISFVVLVKQKLYWHQFILIYSV